MEHNVPWWYLKKVCFGTRLMALSVQQLNTNIFSLSINSTPYFVSFVSSHTWQWLVSIDDNNNKKKKVESCLPMSSLSNDLQVTFWKWHIPREHSLALKMLRQTNLSSCLEELNESRKPCSFVYFHHLLHNQYVGNTISLLIVSYIRISPIGPYIAHAGVHVFAHSLGTSMFHC